MASFSCQFALAYLYSSPPTFPMPLALFSCGGCRRTVPCLPLFIEVFRYEAATKNLLTEKGAGSGVWWRDQNTSSRRYALGEWCRSTDRSNRGQLPPQKTGADLVGPRSQQGLKLRKARGSSLASRYFPLPCRSTHAALSRKRK